MVNGTPSLTLNESQLVHAAKELLYALMNKQEKADQFYSLVLPQFSAFGIGREETIEEGNCLFLLHQGMKPSPDIHYQLLRITPKLEGCTGVVEGELNFLILTEQQVYQMYARYSLVFVQKEDGWKGISGHISAPFSGPDVRETTAFKALEAKNEELLQLACQREGLLQQRTEELEKALCSLRAAQAQLVQQEKLATLGELTAGITHEVRNPLNFVNNFAEVNVELSQELKAEMDKIPVASEQKEKIGILLEELIQSGQKINFHGKRADAIVKSMLRHSRKSTGEKEPTDINALVDEYLRLSYYGLRAKDKTFNVALRTNFDDCIEIVSIIPQDMGHVLLNLFNNAFYSVTEKKKKVNGLFNPEVSVTTKKENNHIRVCIKDNGMGISRKESEKIFQPFFTTKPAGEGTGLGLSLSYDIVTKEHGGEIKVNSEEGTYAEFIITLPAE